MFRTRVDAARKRNAEKILGRLGLTPGQVVNAMFAQVAVRQGVPFPLTLTDDGYLPHVPNAETLASLREPAEGKSRTVRGFLRAMSQA
ncbi:MAG: type II toxin-antitoxin system RelB/DinJ family antitoxin [Opitutaceae bacterium]|nr:type II toxin-antitoxin system RelB/DinJ family antitoxin [Opitutaceae bacterium]